MMKCLFCNKEKDIWVMEAATLCITCVKAVLLIDLRFIPNLSDRALVELFNDLMFATKASAFIKFAQSQGITYSPPEDQS